MNSSLYKTNIPKDKIHLFNSRDQNFIAEGCLGKVAKHLRLLGWSCICDPSYTRNYMMYQAIQSNSVIITKSLEFCNTLENSNKRQGQQIQQSETTDENDSDDDDLPIEMKEYYAQQKQKQLESPTSCFYYYIWIQTQNTNYEQQVQQIVNYLHLEFLTPYLFTRCLVCNEKVEHVHLEELQQTEIDQIEQKIGSKVFAVHKQKLTRCKQCGRVFWFGDKVYRESKQRAWELSYHPPSDQNHCSTEETAAYPMKMCTLPCTSETMNQDIDSILQEIERYNIK